MAIALMRIAQLLAATGLSRSSVYAKNNPNSSQFDPTFPKPVPLGARAVAWPSNEVEAWIQSRIDAARSVPVEAVARKTRRATDARRKARKTA